MFRSLQEAAQNSFEEVNTRLAITLFNHLDVLSFQSALVVAVGILFAIAALLDGYFSDDPYPGYGAKWQARKFTSLPTKTTAIKTILPLKASLVA